MLLATVALGVAYVRSTPIVTSTMRFVVPPPENGTFSSVYGVSGNSGSISPDGRHLAFVASVNSGAPTLWVRSLDSLAPRVLPGTEGANDFPFWSPDSRSLAFVSNNQLLRIDVAGGAPQAVCSLQSFFSGGAWGRAGVILFTEGSRIKRVAATGGQPATATAPDVASGWPSFLPDGRHFLYQTPGAIYVASLDAQGGQRLLAADTNAVYAPPGYLLFMRQNVLLAQAFDSTSLKVTGEPVPIADHVASNGISGFGVFSASEAGILTYRVGGGSASVTQLTWLDRTGKTTGVLGQPGPYGNQAISPDGTRVAVERRDATATNIWIFDRARGTPSRFTFNNGLDVFPTWSPDGVRIAFGSVKPGGVADLFQKSSGGAGDNELVFKSNINKLPTDWSSDGRHLLYFADSKGGFNLWMLPLTGNRQPIPFLETPFNDTMGTMSPDGRWVAYMSNESGRLEVYVQSFPASGGKWQISVNGGTQPKWRRDGKELFFLDSGGTVQAVDVQGVGAGKDFRAGAPRPLFKIDIDSLVVRNSYDVTADGQQFLVNVLTPTTGTSAITVVTNWTAGLRK